MRPGDFCALLALCAACGGGSAQTQNSTGPAGTKHPELFTGLRWSGNLNQSFSCNGAAASNRSIAAAFALSPSGDPAHDLEYTSVDGCLFRFDLNLSKPGEVAVATLGNTPVTCVGRAADGSPIQEESDAYRIATNDGKTLSFHAVAKSSTSSVACLFTDDGTLTSSPIPVAV